jgi:hypothetical protein
MRGWEITKSVQVKRAAQSLALTLALFHGPAQAVTECTPIDTVPVVIEAAGEHCLIGDLSFLDGSPQTGTLSGVVSGNLHGKYLGAWVR